LGVSENGAVVVLGNRHPIEAKLVGKLELLQARLHRLLSQL